MNYSDWKCIYRKPWSIIWNWYYSIPS